MKLYLSINKNTHDINTPKQIFCQTVRKKENNKKNLFHVLNVIFNLRGIFHISIHVFY